MQWVACLGGVESAIIECFEKGGGVPYSAFERFHEIMLAESGPVIDRTLVQRTLPLVPGLVEQLEEGVDVVDVGCGSGHAVNVMARAFPKSRVTGYDIAESGIEAGRAEAAEWGLANARFEVRDVAAMTDDEAFDFVTTFDAIHDQANPAAVLAGSTARCARAAPTSWSTSRPRATCTRTSTTRSARSSTPLAPCTA